MSEREVKQGYTTTTRLLVRIKRRIITLFIITSTNVQCYYMCCMLLFNISPVLRLTLR